MVLVVVEEVVVMAEAEDRKNRCIAVEIAEAVLVAVVLIFTY